MSSRQHLTSCSRLLKTSGPMKPATSLTMKPRPFGLHLRQLDSYSPAEAVLPRLEDHHVDAVGRTVGEFRSLPGFEVESISFAILRTGILHDFVDRDVEDLVAVVRSREALETSWRPSLGNCR